MITTVAFLAALSLAPAQTGSLKLTNVRTTYGVLGPERRDTKLLPGDLFVLSFDIEGAKVNAQGKVQYSIGMEISDSQGKTLFKQAPHDSEADSPARPQKLPACAKLQIGMDAPAGDYNVKVIVTDRATGASRELARSYQLLPKAFGLVRLTTTSDPDGKIPVASFLKGKPSYINFTAVGFGRDAATGQPRLRVAMRAVDEKDRPVLAETISAAVNQGVAEKARALPMQFELILQQAGTSTIELTATDEVTGEKTTLTLPVKVAQSK